jgi:hypothetical protein
MVGSVGLILGGLLLVGAGAALYYIVRAAVRDGMLEAWERRGHD